MPQLRISHFRLDRNFKLKVKAQIVEKIKILKYETFSNFLEALYVYYEIKIKTYAI